MGNFVKTLSSPERWELKSQMPASVYIQCFLSLKKQHARSHFSAGSFTVCHKTLISKQHCKQNKAEGQTNKSTENYIPLGPSTAAKLGEDLARAKVSAAAAAATTTPSAPPTEGISGLICQVHAEAFLYQLYQ